jgi:hypothetical protein
LLFMDTSSEQESCRVLCAVFRAASTKME